MSAARLDEPRVAAARLWGATHFPYLATALFASPIVAAPGLGSIAVDRSWRLYIDPEIVRRWSAEEIGSVLVHHVGHLLRDHAGRADQLGIDDASETAWAAAADAEINDDLVETDASFPLDPIVPSALGCEAGGFAEDYFRSIRDSEELAPGECGSGAHGQHRDWELHADGVPEISPAGAHLLRCKVASEIRSGRGGSRKASRHGAPGLADLGGRDARPADRLAAHARRRGPHELRQRRRLRRLQLCAPVTARERHGQRRDAHDAQAAADDRGRDRHVAQHVGPLLRRPGRGRRHPAAASVSAATACACCRATRTSTGSSASRRRGRSSSTAVAVPAWWPASSRRWRCGRARR